MTIRFRNQATSTLKFAVNDASPTIIIQDEDISKFPSQPEFYLTLEDPVYKYFEVVKVTTVVNNTFTVVRGQDGTSAVPWPEKAPIRLSLNRAALDTFVQGERTLTAGDGLTGGGDLSDDREVAVDGSVVRTTRRVNTGAGISGGGDLTSDRTLTLDVATSGTIGGVKPGQHMTVTADGTLDVSVSGALVYQGTVDPGASEPSASAGHTYLASAAVGSSTWSGISGQSVTEGALLIYDGANWAISSTSFTGVESVSGDGSYVVIGGTATDPSISLSSDVVVSDTEPSGGWPINIAGNAATSDALNAILTAGDGLSGGGALDQNRSFAVDGTVARTSRALTAGDGLSGGGDLTQDRSFAVDASVTRTSGNFTISGTWDFGVTPTVNSAPVLLGSAQGDNLLLEEVESFSSDGTNTTFTRAENVEFDITGLFTVGASDGVQANNQWDFALVPTVNGSSVVTDVNGASGSVNFTFVTDVNGTSGSVTLAKGDVGLGSVPNVANTVSTSDPSGGNDGDIWDKVT